MSVFAPNDREAHTELPFARQCDSERRKSTILPGGLLLPTYTNPDREATAFTPISVVKEYLTTAPAVSL